MSTTVQRIYKTKDVDMLIAASTIIETAIANKGFLQTKRSTWADPFFENLQTEINTTIQSFLGIDSAKDLRQATQVVLSIQKQAIKDLAEVKVQLVEDFKSNPTRKTEILTQLGFTSYFKQAQKGDQEALINLLYQFKTNLSPTLATEIETQGIAMASLTNITNYADTLKTADITQESNKGVRRVITAEAITQFNLIYNKVISVSKISTKFFKDSPAQKEQFSFNKVSKTINASRKSATTTSPTV